MRGLKLRAPGAASVGLLIDRERDALDRVAAEIAAGVTGQAHYADLRDRIDGIAARLRRAMREGCL